MAAGSRSAAEHDNYVRIHPTDLAHFSSDSEDEDQPSVVTSQNNTPSISTMKRLPPLRTPADRDGPKPLLSPGYRFPSVASTSAGPPPSGKHSQRPPALHHAGGFPEAESGRDGQGVEAKHAGQSKMTATVKSPRSSDMIEVSPFFHVREDPHSALPSGLSTPGGSDGDGLESADDYDWSGEEDLADQQAKFGEQIGQKIENEGWTMKRIGHFLFSSLIGSILLAGILIIPPIIVHFYWYKPHPTDNRRFIDENIQAWLFWAAANVVISWFLAMIVDVIPILTRFFLSATWGHVSEGVKSRLEMFDSVKDTAKPVLYAASGLASWVVIFTHIYGMYSLNGDEPSLVAYTDRVYQVILYFFFFTLVICAQKMLTHYVAWNFHRLAYRERIEEVETALSVIEKLRRYRPKAQKWNSPAGGNTSGHQFWQKDHYRMLNSALRSQAPTPQDRDGDLEGGDQPLDYARKKRQSFLDVSFEDNTLINNTLREPNLHGGPGGSSQENHIEKIPLEDIHPPSKQKYTTRPYSPSGLGSHHRTTPGAVRSPASTRHSFDHSTRHAYTRSTAAVSDGEAIVQAAKVLKNAVLHDARNLKGQHQDMSSLAWNVNSTREAKRLARSIFHKLKDRHRKYLVVSDFYPVFSSEEEAETAFRIFDTDANGDLSRPEMKIKLVKTYRERRSLSRSLKDVGAALKTLDRILLCLATVVLFFISLSVFGLDIAKSLTSVYSLGIAASFIFKNSARGAFDAIMFIFVTHPYDTGDRIFIDEENLVVKKVGLFATVFARSDGTQTYYFNSQLFTKFITNARRSDKTTEVLTLQVSWKTPLTKLDALEKCLNDWLSTEEHRWFQPKTGVTLQHIVYQRYLELTIGIPHNGNWQDWGLRNSRKTAFCAAVQYYCRQLGITGYEAPLPVVFNQADAAAASLSLNLAQFNQTEQVPLPEAPLSPNDDEPPVVGEEEVSRGVKASLGFLPPVSTSRFFHLARPRKSRRSRKNNLGAMNAEC